MNRPPDFPPVLEAALFDFDETLIDLELQHDAAHRALCAAMGSDYDALPESFRFGSGRRIVDDIEEMRRFFDWSEPLPQLYELRHEHFLRELRGAVLELLPGAESIIRSLHEIPLTLAVTTSADAGAAAEILERFGLRDCFATIVGGSEVARGKPDPEAYLVTAGKLGVDPQLCLVFEDSHVGVLAARNAGMYCVAIRNPRARQRQDLSPAGLVLESFEEFDSAWVRGAARARPAS